jgi:hypothetical protein
MEGTTKDNIKKTKSMAKASIRNLMAPLTTEDGDMESSMEEECSPTDLGK